VGDGIHHLAIRKPLKNLLIGTESSCCGSARCHAFAPRAELCGLITPDGGQDARTSVSRRCVFSLTSSAIWSETSLLEREPRRAVSQLMAMDAARFLHGWLRTHDLAESLTRAGNLTPQVWDHQIANRLPRMNYSHYVGDRDGVRAWIAALKVHGVALLEGVPEVSRQLLEVARRIGPVRAGNFGEYYDVVSMPKPNASAYTSMSLELHTDLANWRYPPDIQLLFCLKSDVKGGDSVFADGSRVAAELRGATVFPSPVLEQMYAAMGKFWRILRDPKYQLHLRLRPGGVAARGQLADSLTG
jgi:hypothetical protein